MRQIPALWAFNRGLVSSLAVARIDQKRVALGASTMVNWISRVLGPMSLRPGLKYIGATSGNAACRQVDFVYATSDSAVLEFTNLALRIWINDTLLTRPAVTTTLTNGTFAGSITGWTDNSDAGGAISYLATNRLKLVSNGTARAIADQLVSVPSASIGVEHALRVVIDNGPVVLRVGSTSAGDEYISETTLETGTFSLAFTPTGDFYVRFQSTLVRQVMVSNCTLESAGVVSITSPYPAASLSAINADQSADVVYLACSGYQQRKVERRGTRPNARSWGICLYRPEDGPFKVQNVGPTTIAASGVTGNVTLTASLPLFKSTHVGALFSLTSTGQTQTRSIAAENTFSSSIRVTGIGNSRAFGIVVANTFVGTVTLQYSADDASWSDVSGKTWTAPATDSYIDGLNNQIIYYRIGVKTGGYTSGTMDVTLSFTAGTQRGIARITAYSSNVSASAEVLSTLGATAATSTWQEGNWSDKSGWPTAVRFHEGRLGWAGQNAVWESVSGLFSSFDETVTGDSGTISRTIGSGPVDQINWMLSLQRKVLGTQGGEYSIRSSAIDSPLTPTDYSIKNCSGQGSTAVSAVKIDQQGAYVDRTGIKIFRLDFDMQNYLYPDYNSTELTAMVPELGLPQIVRLAVQRKPDTRIHAIRSDGVAMVGIFDKLEDVLCWQLVQTDGSIEDVCVLPAAVGSVEDQVYYVVARSINGSTVRYREKWASEVDCRGGTQNLQADSFVSGYNGVQPTISGLAHLEGKSVIVWADGIDYSPGAGSAQATYTVTGGKITLASPVSYYVVGLPYTAQWESAKVAVQQSTIGTTLSQQKRISHLGLMMAWVHRYGLRYGTDFGNLQDLPGIEAGRSVGVNEVRTVYDEQEFEFPAEWLVDMRLCLQAQAPRPCTVLAAIVDIEIHN